ncbi:hypothetical protein [Aquimarina hainanensis]|uniref:hypothetical protein n=1 Tax=Aquimarina hainanensis TaxID=1578017 RepID=UPI00360B101F
MERTKQKMFVHPGINGRKGCRVGRPFFMKDRERNPSIKKVSKYTYFLKNYYFYNVSYAYLKKGVLNNSLKNINHR